MSWKISSFRIAAEKGLIPRQCRCRARASIECVAARDRLGVKARASRKEPWRFERLYSNCGPGPCNLPLCLISPLPPLSSDIAPMQTKRMRNGCLAKRWDHHSRKEKAQLAISAIRSRTLREIHSPVFSVSRCCDLSRGKVSINLRNFNP